MAAPGRSYRKGITLIELMDLVPDEVGPESGLRPSYGRTESGLASAAVA